MDIIKLILFDNITKKEFYIYPTELCHIDYFNALFNNFKEKDSRFIQIIVPNTGTTYDIILSEIFPNQKFHKENIDYLKKWFICQNFLSIQPDLSLLNNLILKPNDFDILLDIVDLIGYDDDTIKILNKYVPGDYDLSLLPRKLLKQMLKLSKMELFVAFYTNNIHILDCEYGQKVATLNKKFYRGHTRADLDENFYFGENDYIYSVSVCEINNQIAIGSKDCLRIYELTTMKQIININKFDVDPYDVNSIIYSLDGQYIVFSYEKKIDVRKIINHDLISWKIFEHPIYARVTDISHDNTHIISLSLADKMICIFNLETDVRKTIILPELSNRNMMSYRYMIKFLPYRTPCGIPPEAASQLCRTNKNNSYISYLENNSILIYNMDGILFNKIQLDLKCSYILDLNPNKFLLYEKNPKEFNDVVHILNTKNNKIICTFELKTGIYIPYFCVSKTNKNIIFIYGMQVHGYNNIIIQLNIKTGLAKDIMRKMVTGIKEDVYQMHHINCDTSLSTHIKKFIKNK
jgi:WD40 repeat protein